ncbi:antibiotic biosynthesis monooxygenase [Devosia sp. PTR5]|uniref:Antibiotic biosynthesis monooxygenase n=1 Tax=Devosia oryzisoli TaxID=2774138 RepID=A0A927IPK4_9HYPH|nr:antibiotic biosynthesis monooxygenase [Devosia oryzisoli]MBD8064650.1 antibiotic biosynthesis monooxygenase [Devosia oryzisoli]
MSGKVRLTGTLICGTDAECDAVRQYLPEHIRLTRQEPGCLSFEVAQSSDPLVWTVKELFLDRAAFDAHQVRTKGSEWASQTATIRRDYTIIAADRS